MHSGHNDGYCGVLDQLVQCIVAIMMGTVVYWTSAGHGGHNDGHCGVLDQLVQDMVAIMMGTVVYWTS